MTKMPFAYGLAKASFGVLMILETWLRSIADGFLMSVESLLRAISQVVWSNRKILGHCAPFSG